MSEQVPIAVPIAAAAVGLAFVLIGLLRPGFIWQLGKVRAGREWLGEGGMTGLLVVFGLILIGVGVAVWVRR